MFVGFLGCFELFLYGVEDCVPFILRVMVISFFVYLGFYGLAVVVCGVWVVYVYVYGFIRFMVF